MMHATTSAVSMSGRNLGKEQIRKLTLAAMLTAVVVVLALLGTSIRFGVFNINLALVPIVIGAAMLGVWYGAWFGFINAMVILLSGDAALFLTFNAAGTVVTVLLKGILAGLIAGAVYSLVSSKSKYAAVLLAALVCPIVNTGIFVLGCRVFFWKHIPAIAEIIGVSAESRSKFIFTVLVGLNFPAELVVNMVLAPVIARILGFSKDKNVSLIVYGCVLAVVGLGFGIFGVILMQNAWNGGAQTAITAAVEAALESASEGAKDAAVLAGTTAYETSQSLGVRYLIMSVFSAIAMMGGVTMIGIGKALKK